MLYFSKLKVIFIYILIIFLSYFTILNFLSQNYKLFDNKKLSSLSIKFAKENNDKTGITKYMVTNLSFEKYNTKYNYFFVSGFFNKL